jgi:hypothetical protein
VERFKGADQVFDRAGEAVEAPDDHGLERAGPGGLHQPVERRPPLRGARDAAVDELLDHLPAPLGGVGAEGGQLDLGVLALGGHTGIEGDPHGLRLL